MKNHSSSLAINPLAMMHEEIKVSFSKEIQDFIQFPTDQKLSADPH